MVTESGKTERRPAIRPFSILLGALLIPPASLWVAAMEEVYGGRPTYLSIFFHAVLILIAVFACNSLLQMVAPRRALNRMEILVLYVMIGVSSGIVGEQYMAVLIPSLADPFWYADDINRWRMRLFPHLPTYAMVSDPVAVRNLYEGSSSFYLRENFLPWLGPGLLWAGFVAVTQLMCLGLNVLMRRQWTDYEKLSFPLVEIPMNITTRGAISLWRNRLFWAGFILAGTIDLINGLHFHWPMIPAFNVKLHYITFPARWSSALTSMYSSFYPFIIGLSFLLPVDLIFSIWFFFFVSRGERLLFSALGYRSVYPWGTSVVSSPPAVLEQSIGAYLAIVAFALWAARRHLRTVWAAISGAASPATGGAGGTISRAEVREYQWALALLAGGFLLTTWFANSLGMPVILGFFYIFFYLALNAAIAKMRAEAGIPTHGFHMAGPDRLLLTMVGPRGMSVRQMSAWALFSGLNRSYTGTPMPHQLEGMKMGEMLGAEPSRITFAEALATVIGSVASVWALLHLCYRHGVEHHMLGPVQWMSRRGWKMLDSWMNTPTSPNWGGLAGIIFGVFFASFLTLMRLRFVWWPFHPMGYALAPDWTVGTIWIPMMIGWAAKSTIMRYLGPRTYRAAIPFFLGLVLGEFVVGGAWEVLAMILGEPQYAFWQ